MSIRKRHVPLAVFLSLLCVAVCGRGDAEPPGASPLSFAFEDIDTDRCALYADGKEADKPSAEALKAVFGFGTTDRKEAWNSGKQMAIRRDFRITFKRPVPIGTICTEVYTGPDRKALQPIYGRFISLLKADAPYPGDVAKEDQWVLLPRAQVKTLEATLSTRGLRVTTIASEANEGHPGNRDSTLFPILCLKDRFFSPLIMGSATFYPTDKLGKTGYWLQSWVEPRPVTGIAVFIDFAAPFTAAVLDGKVRVSPQIAAEANWANSAAQKLNPGMQWITLKATDPTRAIRLAGPDARHGESFGLAVPLSPLKPGEALPTTEGTPPPVGIQYEMPFDGFSALQVHEKSSGNLVRRLYAEIAGEKGAVKTAWDLKDDAGNYVAPGEYAWKAIARPPFKLTYELTANNAGQPAWWAPPPGKGGGGWLGDHGSPNCAAAMGDMMWFGTLCAENGHVAIATDLDGNKLWGTHHIAYGFRGPTHITCDDKAAYLVTHELINRVVPSRDFQMREIFTCRPSSEFPWFPVGYDATLGGAAARDGKLYWSINAPPENWLKSSFLSDAIDPKQCMPSVGLFKGKGHRSGRGDKNYGESEYDELMQLYATFLTEKTPDENTPTLAGMGIPSSTQASLGEAPKNGKYAGSVIVVFKQPVTVGSVLVPDAGIKVYALKAGLKASETLKAEAEGTMEEDKPKDETLTEIMENVVDETDPGTADETWVRLQCKQKPGAPGVAVAPPGGIKTMALRYKVYRLAFSQVVTRRFANCAPDARIVSEEGTADPAGGWVVKRDADRALCRAAPAYAAILWPSAKALRALSFSHPLLGEFEVSVWKGGSGDPAKSLKEDPAWEKVGLLKPDPPFNGYFPQTPTCRHMEFGRVVNTSAVRIKVLAGSENAAGFRGVVAWTPAGDDPKDLPTYMNERIAVLQMPPLDDDKSEATVVRNIPIPKPGGIALDAKGTLYCISDGRIVTVPLDGKGEPKTVVERGQLESPMSLAADAQGQLYVSDAATRNIKVFDAATGKLARTIGAGPQKLGHWDPARLDNPMQVAVDKLGRVWVADATYQPKRIQRFKPDGTPDRFFLGPVQYGGGGWLDERNRSLIYYNGMKFTIDWQKRDWQLDSLIFRPGDPRSLDGTAMPDRVIYHQNRRYLIGPQCAVWGAEGVAVICAEKDGIAVPMAAIGRLSAWGDVDRRPDLSARFGAVDRMKRTFCWVDRNGDGQPQADEVQTVPYDHGSWGVGNDLTLYTVAGNTGVRLKPQRIREDGIPEYDLKRIETFTSFVHGPGARTNAIWGTEDGRIFMIGTRLIAADGKTRLWEYYDPFACHEGFYQSRFGYDRPPGALNQEHRPVGHIQVGPEEFFITNSDQGDWFCYTGDGMLVGCIFGGPTGYGLRRWTMPQWEPGKVDLSDVRLPQEHYQGCVVKAEDGKVYAVAGHNHMSIVRVEGLEQLRRLQGIVTVTAGDLAKTREWDVHRAALAQQRQEQKGMKVRFVKRDLEVTGALTVWPPEAFVTIHERWVGSLSMGKVLADQVKGALAYNNENLFVAVRARAGAMLRNSAKDPIRLFQGGDAVDVTLGLDPKADPKRTAPVAGDVRLLFSIVQGKPVAVLYRPVAPDAPASEHARFESPVGTTLIDQVKVIPEARVAVKSEAGQEDRFYWTLAAAVPWKAIGVEPPKSDAPLRGDIGVLRSDPNGVVTASRLYWSGKSQTVVCDVPSETRLIPALWGELLFEGHDFVEDLEGKGVDDFAPEAPEMKTGE